jgi:flagellar biosynthesis anti-sigma factor FlgM
MKIDQQKGVLDPRLGPTDAVRAGTGGAPAAPAPPARGDRVSVSEGARELSRLRAAVGDVDAIRPDRVDALRAAVMAGRYHPDLGQVARTLLRELLGELLG